MRPSLKLKEDWPARDGPALQHKRRRNCAGGSDREINSFTRRTERVCDTHPATRPSYSGFKTLTIRGGLYRHRRCSVRYPQRIEGKAGITDFSYRIGILTLIRVQ